MIVPGADFHMHTVYSDGALTPRELLERARGAGLRVVSITDHDNVSGIREALTAAEEFGVELVPGVELSAHVDGREVHMLGYFIDIENVSLNQFLSLLREERLQRAERMVEKLKTLNIPIRMEQVLERAGKGSVGRPHVANVIIDEGFAESHQEVFTKYIGYKGPAYVEKFQCSPEEVISLIAAAGGLSFLAHPGNSVNEQTISRLIKAGMDGIETIHPSHSPEMVAHYKGVVHEYFLLECGGSDFHGGRRNDDAFLGRYTIPLTSIDAMRKRLVTPEKDYPKRA